MAVRITSGEFRGRRVALPRGSRARPLTGQALEQVMNLFTPARLSSGPFLDVCAGSGLAGLEALSRGAPLLLSVDVDSAALRGIRRLAAEWGAADRLLTLRRDGRRCFAPAQRMLPEGQRFACALLDPPFIEGMAAELLRGLGPAAAECLDASALAIIRTPDRLPEGVAGLEFIGCRDAGRARLWLYRPADAPQGGEAP